MVFAIIIFILIDIIIFVFFSRLLKQRNIKDAFYLIILIFAFIFFVDFFIAKVFPLIEIMIPIKINSSNTDISESIGIALIYLVLFSALFFAIKLEIYTKRHQKDLPLEEIKSLSDNTIQIINNLSNVKTLRLFYLIIRIFLIFAIITQLIYILLKTFSLIK